MGGCVSIIPNITHTSWKYFYKWQILYVTQSSNIEEVMLGIERESISPNLTPSRFETVNPYI